MRAKRRMGRSIAIAGLLLAAFAIDRPLAPTKALVTHEAIWLMPRAGAPTVSPDGRWAVFSVTDPAYDEKEQSSELWIVAADGTVDPRRLTSTKASESGVASRRHSSPPRRSQRTWRIDPVVQTGNFVAGLQISEC